MPLSNGFGKWPQEYGVGVQPDRLEDKRCAICIQKKCFSCEHQTQVKSSIFQHQPYLNPSERFTISDRDGTVASYRKQNNLTQEQYEQEINNLNFNKNQTKSDYKFIDPKNKKNPYEKNDSSKNSTKSTPRDKENSYNPSTPKDIQNSVKNQQNSTPYQQSIQLQNMSQNNSNNNQLSSNNKNQKVSTRAPPPSIKPNNKDKAKKEGGCTIL